MSGRKKPLSFEEKRKRLLELFYETKDFWQLKELEKMAQKQKGIVGQTVKEVLDSLVADNLVTGEKIGTSNYFWSFPSTAGQLRQETLKKLKKENGEYLVKKADLSDALESGKSGREETEERTELLNQLATLEQENNNLQQELQKFKEFDPVNLEKKKREALVLKQEANRWTENIFNVRQYCVKQFGMVGKSFDQSFQIPEDFDTL